MFVDRSSGSLAHVEWKVRLFGAGAILAVVGIWSQQGWLINLAIAVLLLRFALRFLSRRAETESHSEDDSQGT
ncbi:MAG: hypothetical protein EXR95_05455 [Gemmatimonadetes bacterium]|nr:hypothetical protein [Gemmatimonadota bacterium]